MNFMRKNNSLKNNDLIYLFCKVGLGWKLDVTKSQRGAIAVVPKSTAHLLGGVQPAD